MPPRRAAHLTNLHGAPIERVLSSLGARDAASFARASRFARAAENGRAGSLRSVAEMRRSVEDRLARAVAQAAVMIQAYWAHRPTGIVGRGLSSRFARAVAPFLRHGWAMRHLSSPETESDDDLDTRLVVDTRLWYDDPVDRRRYALTVEWYSYGDTGAGTAVIGHWGASADTRYATSESTLLRSLRLDVDPFSVVAPPAERTPQMDAAFQRVRPALNAGLSRWRRPT